jgi:hyperosmotically inducible periplasmic protein
MKEKYRALFVAVLVAAPILAMPNSADALAETLQNQRNDERSQQRLLTEVRHQLVMLPWYSVFDNLEYQVQGDKVILIGQVTRPTLKSDAEGAVKSIEGVSTVVNNIEVLPPSPMDDQIRRAVYRAIYGETGLARYSIQAVPSVHIIVKGGHVALEGIVDTQADKELANLRANQVPNVFSVDNRLRVSGSK